jgi:4a-hydroxytetrahydrobiopterin dehydratase
MSEQGWRDFLTAEGLDDWVVLHGGPTAVFRTGSMAEAARLAMAVAEVSGLDTGRSALSVTARGLGVRLTREMWGVEAQHIDVARAISAVAREHGATADRSAVQEVQIAVSAKPADLDVGFWRAVLGYDTKAPDNGIDPLGHGSTFWVQDLPEEKPLRHAMHIDVSVAREHAEARLQAALAAGGRIVDDSEAPGAWILADRAGNKVCIAAWPDGARPATSDIEPDSQPEPTS